MSRFFYLLGFNLFFQAACRIFVRDEIRLELKQVAWLTAERLAGRAAQETDAIWVVDPNICGIARVSKP